MGWAFPVDDMVIAGPVDDMVYAGCNSVELRPRDSGINHRIQIHIHQ